MSYQKSIIIGLFIVGLIIGGAILLSQPSQKSDASPAPSYQGQLIAETTDFDFGTISMAKGKVSTTFSLKNNGQESAMIKKLYTSCMCTTATLIHGSGRRGPFGMAGHGIIPRIDEAIAPGEQATVEVEFDPAAHGPAGVGTIERIVVVETNSGNLELNIKTVVTP